MKLRQNSHSHAPSSDDSLSVTLAALLPRRSDRAAVRSAGWAFARLGFGIEILKARFRNGTLAPPLAEFMSRLELAGHVHADGQLEFRIAVPDQNGESPRILPETVLAFPAGAILLAVFWLPALRTFWERTLRRNRYRQMRCLLPRAWFITGEDPPPGTILPGLGIASKTRLPALGRVRRIPGTADDRAPSIIIEDERPLHASILVATYADQGGSVNLSSVELEPLPPSHG